MSVVTEEKPARQATILHFSRKRGRPRSPARPRTDTGTPELVMKRLLGETAETLDLCLERGIITAEQHWCGVHLRWLYTLRHGAPGIRAVDPTHIGGMENKLDDPEWRGAREKEYHEAMARLTETGHALLLMNLCIYNERPPFLHLRKPVDARRRQALSAMIVTLQEGLDVLVQHWSRQPRRKK